MIIGETYNENNYYGEENYDYLFKRKTKEERQQKKTDRKDKREVKKVIRQGKREEKKLQKEAAGTGGKRKLSILGNFGLFDKNKNKTGTPGSASSSSAKRESGDSSESSRTEESKSSAEIKLAAAGATAAGTQDKSEGGNTSGGESNVEGSAAAKLENKELDKNGNPTKEAGFGSMLGFAFLGITILLAGVAIYKAGNKPLPNTSPLKVAA